MIDIIIVILTILFISFAGAVIIKGFDLLSDKGNLAIVGYSYGLGVGLMTLQLYFYSRIGISWSRESIITPWIIITGYIITNNIRKFRLVYVKIPKVDLICKVLLIGIILTVFYVFFEAIIRPVSTWDAWATWLLKSKIFFIDGYINPKVLDYIQSDYPLIINLLGTLIYIMLGKIDDTVVLLTSFAFYLFLGALIFSFLRQKKYSIFYSLLFLFLYLSIQNFIRHGGRIEAGQADLPLGYYFFACATLLVDYLKKIKIKNLILLSIFMGITTLIKVEGIVFTIALVILITYKILREKKYIHFSVLILWIAPYLDWQIFKLKYGLENIYFSGHIFESSAKKTINAFIGILKEFINIKSWNLLWISYFFSLILKKRDLEIWIFNYLFTFQLTIYLVLYLFTKGNNPESSIERLLIHVAPLALCAVAITLHSYFFSSDKN